MHTDASQKVEDWGFSNLAVSFGGSHMEDHNVLGSILGSTYFGKLPDQGAIRQQTTITQKPSTPQDTRV